MFSNVSLLRLYSEYYLYLLKLEYHWYNASVVHYSIIYIVSLLDWYTFRDCIKYKHYTWFQVFSLTLR